MAKGWLGILTGLLLLSACRSMDVYKMEMLRPAYINHTIGEAGVLLIDNAGLQPPYMGHTFMMLNSQGEDSVSTVIVNAAQAKPLLLTYLRGRMEDVGFYPTVDVLPDTCLPERKTSILDFAQSDPLTDSQFDTLKTLYPHRLWITLDGWQLKTVTKAKANNPLLDGWPFEATRDVCSAVVWRLYDMEADSLIIAFKQNDTLYWRRGGYTIQQAAGALPTVDKTLPEIADYVVGRVLNVLTPYWESISRWYFIAGSYRMKLAHDAIRMGNWEKAATYWEEECAKGIGRSAYRSAFNMMLYYERLDQPDVALEWSERVARKMDQPLSQVTQVDRNLLANWRKTLLRRTEELKRLTP